jgi:hypothetical protein
MMMPETWRPEHKLFPHQVGFACPPFDYDGGAVGCFAHRPAIGRRAWRSTGAFSNHWIVRLRPRGDAC